MNNAWQMNRCPRLQRDGAPACQENSGNSREKQKQKILEQKMTGQPPPRSAKRRSHGKFALAREQSCQEQVADIRASDQQQEHRSCRKNLGGSVELSEKLVLQRARHQSVSAKRIGMHLLKVLGQRCEICARIDCTDSWLQMPDSPQNAAHTIVRARKAGHRVRKA